MGKHVLLFKKVLNFSGHRFDYFLFMLGGALGFCCWEVSLLVVVDGVVKGPLFF